MGRKGPIAVRYGVSRHGGHYGILHQVLFHNRIERVRSPASEPEPDSEARPRFIASYGPEAGKA